MTRILAAIFAIVLTSSAHAQLIIAHRGASADAPENTIPAFEEAFRQGADGVEGDFYLTRDNRIVCLHDKDTMRTTGVKLVPRESTLAELQALDAGAWKDPKFAGTKIPSIEEVYAVIPPGKLFYIEIKSGPEIVPALKQSLSRCSLKPEQIVIISFKDEVVDACRREMPHLKAQLVQGFKTDAKTGLHRPPLDAVLQRLRQTNATGLDAQANLAAVDEAFVAALRKGGYEFHCWTVDKPEDAVRMKALGVDSITTNKPALIRAAIGR